MMDDDGPDRPEPRRPGAGCLVAAIVAAVGLAIVLVLAVKLLGTALDGVSIR
jgi:hypothetical protein